MWVNKTQEYPVGHPKAIVNPNDQDIRHYFGMAKVDILPPYELYHPLLPHRQVDWCGQPQFLLEKSDHQTSSGHRTHQTLRTRLRQTRRRRPSPRFPMDTPVAREYVNQKKPLLRDKVKEIQLGAILDVTGYKSGLLIGREPCHLIFTCNWLVRRQMSPSLLFKQM